jgi:hypothetical protein
LMSALGSVILPDLVGMPLIGASRRRTASIVCTVATCGAAIHADCYPWRRLTDIPCRDENAALKKAETRYDSLSAPRPVPHLYYMVADFTNFSSQL